MPVRYQTAFLSSLGFLISFGIRCNMGVSVVSMTHNETEKLPNGTVRLIKVTFLCGSSPPRTLVRSGCSIRLDTRNHRHRGQFFLLGLSDHSSTRRLSGSKVSRQSVRDHLALLCFFSRLVIELMI